MYFRAPDAALKEINCYNSRNRQQIITFFQGVFKFMKRHLLDIYSKQLNMFAFVEGMIHFNRFLSLVNFQRRRGAANRRKLAAAVSKRCSTETKTIRRTIPTALRSYHQPGQRARKTLL